MQFDKENMYVLIYLISNIIQKDILENIMNLYQLNNNIKIHLSQNTTTTENIILVIKYVFLKILQLLRVRYSRNIIRISQNTTT